MRPFVRTHFPFVVCLLLAAVPALAQERGVIAGKVADKKTGHALPFATVSLVDQKVGGLTDSEGQYRLAGVAAGTYQIRVQFLGYQPAAKPVTVAAGRTVKVDFELADIVVREEKAIEVTAERRLV